MEGQARFTVGEEQDVETVFRFVMAKVLANERRIAWIERTCKKCGVSFGTSDVTEFAEELKGGPARVFRCRNGHNLAVVFTDGSNKEEESASWLEIMEIRRVEAVAAVAQQEAEDPTGIGAAALVRD